MTSEQEQDLEQRIKNLILDGECYEDLTIFATVGRELDWDLDLKSFVSVICKMIEKDNAFWQEVKDSRTGLTSKRIVLKYQT